MKPRLSQIWLSIILLIGLLCLGFACGDDDDDNDDNDDSDIDDDDDDNDIDDDDDNDDNDDTTPDDDDDDDNDDNDDDTTPDDDDDNDDDDDTGDTDPPVIDHTTVEDGVDMGMDLVITADLIDAGGVNQTRLSYRKTGDSAWTETAMTLNKFIYSAIIPSASLATTGVDYWLWAQDSSENLNEASLPATAPIDFYTFHPFCYNSGDRLITYGGMMYYWEHVVESEFADPFQVTQSSYTITTVQVHFYSSAYVGDFGLDVRVKFYDDNGDTPGNLLFESGTQTVHDCQNGCAVDALHTFTLSQPQQFYNGDKFWISVVYKEDALDGRGIISDGGGGNGMVYDVPTQSWIPSGDDRLFFIHPDGCFVTY